MIDRIIIAKVTYTKNDLSKVKRSLIINSGYFLLIIFAAVFIISTVLKMFIKILPVIIVVLSEPILLLTFVISFGLVGILTYFKAKSVFKGVTAHQYSKENLDKKYVVYRISKTGVEYSSAFENQTCSWNEYASYKETTDRFLIFDTKKSCQYIPKRFFDNGNEDIELVRNYLSKSLPNKSNMKRKLDKDSVILIGLCVFLVALTIFILNL